MTSPLSGPLLHAAVGPRTDRSVEAARFFDDIMVLDPDVRRGLYRQIMGDPTFNGLVLAYSKRTMGTEYGLWQDDPVGFVEDVLHETTWSKQRDVLDSIGVHKRTAVPSAFGTGKCSASLDILTLADGRRVTFGSLVGAGEFEVMGWSEDGTQAPRKARAEWNRVEPVHEVITTGGRRIVRNAAHPLWSAQGERVVAHTVSIIPKVRGWTPVGDLADGDMVLVPERHHAEGDVRVPDDHARLLGYLLGDGGVSQESVRFHKPEGTPQTVEVAEICERLGARLSIHPRCQHIIVGQVTGVGRNPVLNLVREWGMQGDLSKDKRFPDWVWTLPNDQLALVLSRLFACDAWAYTGHHGKAQRLVTEVAIALASEGMVRDIEAAMLRLGVWGVVRHRRMKYQGGARDAWEWRCGDARALLRLREVLGEVPGRTEAINEVVEAAQTRRHTLLWPNRNAPEGYRWEKIASITTLPPEQTVAVEVDGEHTFVTSFVEHNTHIAARAALWRSLVHPVGTSLTVTTATRFRQVQRQMWPHIRRLVKRADLPLICDQTQLRGYDADGVLTDVAYGFSAPPHDEAAVQGIHAPRLFIVVDEAGGIGRIIGKAFRGLMTGDDTRILAIGNPPTDDEDSWFEQFCGEDDVNVVRISAYDAPQLTGEQTKRCLACPTSMPRHSLGSHIVDMDWVQGTIKDYGKDAPFVTAKVHAQFPKGGPSRVIPSDWVDLAIQKPDPEPGTKVDGCMECLMDGHEHYQPLSALIPGEDGHVIAMGSWVRLGVDVAADGGDEFVISRSIGDLVSVRHSSQGAVNTNPLDVAGVIRREIMAAEAVAKAIGSPAKVKVKIDGIGVGWGVAGTLLAWGSEGQYSAQIVPVIVSEATYREDEAATLRPFRKRDEMWLTGRALMQPRDDTGFGSLRLRISTRAVKQLGAPRYSTNSGGRTVVESKKSMRERGVNSPDQGEAILLTVYEPVLKPKPTGEFRVIA